MSDTRAGPWAPGPIRAPAGRSAERDGTMSTSNERALKTIDQMAEREERERQEGLQHALDRGGMPSEREFLAAEAKLRDAYNTLEDLAYRLRGISEFAGCGKELPFDVTSEQIGLAAGFVGTLTTDVIECRQEVDALGECIYPLELIRRERSDI
jgi:hypothetical protein